MASVLRMPGVSADAEEATLLDWEMAQGAEIHPGDVLATLETDKANVEIESDQDAVLWRLLAEPGASVAVGSPIAVLLAIGEEVDDEAAVFRQLGIGSAPDAEPGAAPDPGINVLGTVSVGQADPGADAAEPAAQPDSVPIVETPEEPVAKAATGSSPEQQPAAGAGGRVFASPIARRLARQYNLDTDSIQGTGPGGRIVRADVERAQADGSQSAPSAPNQAATAASMPSQAPAPLPAVQAAAPGQGPDAGSGYTDTPHSTMRRAVAAALTGSKQHAPHFYLTATCRVDALLELRANVNAQSAVRVSINDFILKAVALALRDQPEMNVSWTADAVRSFEDVDVCVAIASDKGLVTPVLRRADTLTLTQIATQVKDFAARANQGKLKQRELEGGTFTVTNLGMFGVETFSAIINPPQVGILAIGAVVTTPIVVDGAIEVGRTVTVTVSADHRPVDGVLVARWLQRFRTLVENPLSMLV